MFVQAETLVESHPQPHLQLVPPIDEAPQFWSADDIPELAFVRERERREARMTMEQNRSATEEMILIPVDALGTAAKVHDVEERFGKESSEYEESFAGLVLDCQRLFGEASRIETWEYFPPLKQDYVEEDNDFYSYGHSTGVMTQNALIPVAEQEEQEVLIHDAVEEVTYRALGRMILGRDLEVDPVAEQVNVTTITPCAKWALRKHQEGYEGPLGGYVPRIEKLKVRSTSFVAGDTARYMEEVAVPGVWYGEDIISAAYQIIGIWHEPKLDTGEVHSTQVVADGVVSALDYVELLDQLASEKHGIEIFMGEPLKEGEFKDYGRVPVEAEKRAVEQEGLANELAEHLMQLERAGMSHDTSTNLLVEAKAREMLLEVSKKNPGKAGQIFGEETAKGFAEANRLENDGEYEAAQALRAQTEANAGPIEFCGAGDSCGLKEVDEMTKRKYTEALGIKPGDTVLEDMVRACSCGGKIIYAFNSKKVNKLCRSCGTSEKKVTPIKKAA